MDFLGVVEYTKVGNQLLLVAILMKVFHFRHSIGRYKILARDN